MWHQTPTSLTFKQILHIDLAPTKWTYSAYFFIAIDPEPTIPDHMVYLTKLAEARGPKVDSYAVANLSELS